MESRGVEKEKQNEEVWNKRGIGWGRRKDHLPSFNKRITPIDPYSLVEN